jgi:6-phosphogluconolactonase
MKQTEEVSLLVAPSKETVPTLLVETITKICAAAIRTRGAFTIALSGGSLANFLAVTDVVFQACGVDPKYECWHVLLADERCVPIDDPDSNLGSLQEHMLSKIPIPQGQIHGINQEKLNDSTDSIAHDYETILKKVLQVSGGFLDLAVLGFGPDGHTCSLFPGHSLLMESKKLVAGIDDSPKPPPKRITVTYVVLNSMTRHVIFCGAGNSKSPILRQIFSTVALHNFEGKESKLYRVTMAVPPPFPCAMVSPNTPDQPDSNTVTWIVDAEALEGVHLSS